MKAVGIVAEYNPFHNGHAYQVNKVRQELAPDVIIAVMSGNFLQRGEPAIVDKWTRTEMAIHAGIDLVIELPTVWSTQSADYFARGAIQILSILQIDTLCFGVEEGQAATFLESAQWWLENEDQIFKRVKQSSSKIPYAQQMEEVLDEINPNFPLYLNSPNNQLGFAYAKEIVKQELRDTIELFPIQRKKAGYDDRYVPLKANIASATAIRLAMLENKNVQKLIPIGSYAVLEESLSEVVTWEDYFPLLKYQLLVQPEEELLEIYEMNEGIENRLKNNIQDAKTFSEFIKKIKTKRYTQTRLQRLLTYVLLQIKRSDVEKAFATTPEIRVLGFTQKGREYLNLQKATLTSSLITNVNQKTKQQLEMDIVAGEIYQLGNDLIKKQDFMRKPYKFD